jgi:hypothetical protein
MHCIVRDFFPGRVLSDRVLTPCRPTAGDGAREGALVIELFRPHFTLL